MEAAQIYPVMLRMMGVGFSKGVKIGLRFALQGLVFEIEAIFEDTLTT